MAIPNRIYDPSIFYDSVVEDTEYIITGFPGGINRIPEDNLDLEKDSMIMEIGAAATSHRKFSTSAYALYFGEGCAMNYGALVDKGIDQT